MVFVGHKFKVLRNHRTKSDTVMHVLALHLQVLEVQVGLVLVGGLVSTVTVGDDWVQQLLEDLVGLLVTSDAAHGHDEGVTLGTRR